MITIEEVRNYFSAHLLRELVFESSQDELAAAAAMAEMDIAAYLGFEPEQNSSCYLAAVCEQTVYLLMHKDQLAEKQTIISERIDGLGSRQYAAPETTADAVLAPRAILFAGSLRSGKNIRLERG